MAIRAAQVNLLSGVVENIVLVDTVEETSPDFDLIPIPAARRTLDNKYIIEYDIVIGETMWDEDLGFHTADGRPALASRQVI